MQTISVIGLGKLGSPFLATCASRGFDVIGLDVNSHFVDLLNQGKAPVDEPNLAQLILKNRKNLKATSDYSEAVNNSDITFIIVPTPSTKNGAFSNEYVVRAVGKIGKILAKKDKFHLVVVVSTIMPKSMDNEIIPALENASGKKLNRDFGICYNPEFIALGSVIDNLLNPDFVLIGESDKNSGKTLESFYHKFCVNKPPIVRMNFVNAEIAKIALNSYITTKISFANTLAQISERVPNGDVDQITAAIGLDKRIGSKYLKGAMPYGGPCFPRDNRAFSSFAKEVGVEASLAKATDLVNENMIAQIVKKVEKTATNKNSKIAILGLAYKPDTDVAEESAGVKVANLLSKKDVKIYVWDPKTMAKV
jgi:UDPglucose 6-dehydrogenase